MKTGGTGLALLGVLGLFVLSAQSRRGDPPADAPGDEAWVRRVIAFVSASEGKPDSLNRNLDGAGLSVGILQWNQHSGALYDLLTAMHAADAAVFERLFGPSWETMLAVTRSRSHEPVEGARLWEEPWVSRFLAALRHPPFAAVQWRLAQQGEHFQGALDVARILGIQTERAVTLFFDRSVQQGPGAARQMAEALKAALAGDGRTFPYAEVLQAYATIAAARFRRSTPPPSPQYSAKSPHLLWKQVGSEWHAVAGRWDLYLDIHKRTSRILASRELSDVPLPRVIA